MTGKIVLLLLIVIPFSLFLWFLNIVLNVASGNEELVQNPVSPVRWLLAMLVPIYLAHRGLKKNSLSPSGAVAGLVVGFVITLSSYCFFAALLMFFMAGSKATKFRAEKKRKMEEDYKEGGQRNWMQVVCNGGIATELALIYMCDSGCQEMPVDFAHRYTASWLSMAVLGSLACANGDTFASEIGSVVGNEEPWLITTFTQVPKGTNGAISVVGTLSSFVGGLVVGVAYYIALLLRLTSDQLEMAPPQWPVILVASLAGLLGSAIDSVIGAVFQYSGYDRKRGCVVEHPGPGVEDISGFNLFNNDAVNLLTVFITSIITPSLAFSLWGGV